MAQQIGDLHERPARADVDGHRAALPRLEEQVLRLAAALAFALLALEDLAGVEQVLHEPADRAAAHAHQPRQFGTRDRLARANEIERDLPVDLPRGAAVGDAELGGVDTTHRRLGRGDYGPEWANCDCDDSGDRVLGSSREASRTPPMRDWCAPAARP